MGDTTIEWTEKTWNPVTGCTKVSPGCDHCYAETLAERFRGTPGHYFENGFDVQLRENKLTEPLRWRKPRKVFVNSMSDLFHDDIPEAYIGAVFDIMAKAPQHTFQILTKRHARMRALLTKWATQVPDDLPQYKAAFRSHQAQWAMVKQWPLPNVWLGVSTENQQWADIRIPALLDTPAAVRFISAEPLLGQIELSSSALGRYYGGDPREDESGLDWVIAGGESGHGARPMHPAWARSLRDQCVAAGVPFLFKQWGEWAPRGPDDLATGERADVFLGRDGRGTYFANRYRADVQRMVRVGKKAAGRELYGRTWDEYPGGDR
ncbi:DUF5131 family protein [Gordonia sp. SCSIO 19800]|uniref:DUF5131 family protein n=1 Tax=Gordonia sp. SCSIO 19800 TaxID=2826926 RepID=UPI001B83A49E|nr:phage Gp37/Gp68 family protein [Gordonia sp. SCSIO 19800]MBR7191698.1 phage Gp37/Gp68 family protein [Gordonia sp. SCSIO 19800]